jgi:cyclophilin family peptidyl-prolyl cis-trans isomerase
MAPRAGAAIARHGDPVTYDFVSRGRRSKRGLLPLAVLAALAPIAGVACARRQDPQGATVASASASTAVLPAETDMARAEDLRRSKDIPHELRHSDNVLVRRRATKALARIGDDAAATALLELLSDADPEVVQWAAFGLGFSCPKHEDVHVRALAARMASLVDDPKPVQDALNAVARATGRCATPLAEEVLVGWLRAEQGKPLGAAALLGLGDLAAKRKALGPAARGQLLSAALAGDDWAFYGLSRADLTDADAPQVIRAAKPLLAQPLPTRLFMIRALGRAGKEAVPVLKELVPKTDLGPSERAEAARVLGQLGDPGRQAAVELLGALLPDKDPFAIAGLAGQNFAVLMQLIGALGAEPPKSADNVLGAAANMVAPGTPPVVLAARLAALRCAAALGLARGAYDTEILRKCDTKGSYAWETARLSSLLRRPVTAERRAPFRELAKSTHLRVREQALEALAAHPELTDLSPVLIADALQSDKAGLVATAAAAVSAHPERVLVLAEREKRAALDPKAPPPNLDRQPDKELDRDVAKALRQALARPWAEDLFETRLSLLDAALSLSLPEAKPLAQKACGDANVTVRERAQKALRALGEAQASCPAPSATATPAKEIGLRPGSPLLTFATASGALKIRLDGALAPITTARLASLARAGFFKGNMVHRVVPGFVVQFGDPGGDGYGGSGTPLRCETSPSPFLPLDVGMALAGRDTGSSQLFVTLARTAHLDGEYTKVGHAEGDWFSVAEGDIIEDATVTE